MADIDIAYLTISETAERLGVNPRTVRRWIQRGDLPAHKQNYPGGFQYAIPASEVDKRLPTDSSIVPAMPPELDRALATLESMSTWIDTVRGNIQGAVQGIVTPIVQGQTQQTEELRRLREELQQIRKILGQQRRPWWRFWERRTGGK